MDENEIQPSPFVDWCGIWPGHGGMGTGPLGLDEECADAPVAQIVEHANTPTTRHPDRYTASYSATRIQSTARPLVGIPQARS